MKTKFVKNLYQILSNGAAIAFLDILMIIPLFMIKNKQQDGIEVFYIFWFSIVIGLPLIIIVFHFYSIFQVVYFDDEGLKISIFKHVIKEVKWIEVEAIEYSNWMRNPTISIYLKNETRINFDRRKKIVEIINKNVSKSKTL